MPDVVLYPGRAASSVTLGPAFVSVSDGSGKARSFPRDGGRGARGAVARLRAHLADGPPALVPPEIRQLSLVDGRGAVLATLRWDGADHDALEAACAAARLPLDRVPEGGSGGSPPGAGQEVVLRLAGTRGGRAPGGGVALTLGPREVAVTAVDGEPLRWPRLGCSDHGEPAVARLRVTLYAEQPANDPDLLPGPPTAGPHRLLALTLFAAGDRPLAHLIWYSRDLETVRCACAASGVLAEYRWQPRCDAAELARHGVPVIRAADAARAARASSSGHSGRSSRVFRSRRTVGTGRAPGAVVAAGSPSTRLRWLLYGAALLVLAALALAVAVLSAR